MPGYWPVAVFEASILGLAISAVWPWRRATLRFAYPLAPLLFAVFWGLLQLSTGRTVSPFETRIALAGWTTLLAVLIVGLVIFSDARIHRWFRSALVWFGFLVAVLATLQEVTAAGKVFWIFQTEYTERVMGPILSPNHYAAFIEAVLPMAICGSLRHKRDSLLYACMAAAMYASVIASASRAGVVLASAEFVIVAVLLWLQGRASGRAVARSLLRVAVLLVIFTAVVGWGTVWERLRSSDPFANRYEFAVSSMRMIVDRPWFGSGLGTWPIVYPKYAIVDTGLFANRAHNDWLEWCADGGIPFGIAMLSLFIWCLRPAFRSAWGIGVIAVFLHAIVDYPFSRPALAAWIVVMITMLAWVPRRHSSTADPGGRSYE
jgi:O-antigen ligase